MNFSGWVAIPRSILSNTHTGRLSSTEQLAFLTLHLLADAKTGSGYINAAALITFLPELKYDTSKRVLQSLEDKRFIFRQITHASKRLYPYWLHGYQISDGPNRLLWTNLSQVFAARDVNAIRYDKTAPETPPDIPPDIPLETPLDNPPNNNHDNDNDLHHDQPSCSLGRECQVSEIVSANVTNRVSHSVRGRDFQVSEIVRENVSDGDGARSLPAGYELREDGCVYSAVSGVRVAPNVVAAMLERGNQP
jgi:hypothetical protein